MSKTTKIVLGVIVAVVLLIILPIIGTYNSLTQLNLNVDQQWSNVEVTLQRRWDLLPRLEAYLKTQRVQESQVFADIAKARTQYGGAMTTEEKVAAANQVESAIGRLLVVVENYPQLKTGDIVMMLQPETAGTENRISVERMRYNENVNKYNYKVRAFPSNIVAGIFGFAERKMFENVAGADAPPPVNL